MIGKALGSCEDGRGLVPVLVALQVLCQVRGGIIGPGAPDLSNLADLLKQLSGANTAAINLAGNALGPSLTCPAGRRVTEYSTLS